MPVLLEFLQILRVEMWSVKVTLYSINSTHIIIRPEYCGKSSELSEFNSKKIGLLSSQNG